MDWAAGDLAERDLYKLLVSTVLPRPIALVTTVDTQGRANAAPFSFFNVFSHAPPLVVLGIDGRKRLFVHRHLAQSCRHVSFLSAAENPARPPS